MESAVKAAEALEGKEVYNRALRLDYSMTTRQSGGGGRGDRAPRGDRGDRGDRGERGSSF